MDVFEAIAARHSYREDYTEARIPRDTLQKIVQAGIQAPSGCNGQTTSFVIVDEPGKLAEIADILGKETVAQAAAVIVCVADHTPVLRNMSFAVEDCAAAVENILLAVAALGYATVWIDGALRAEDRAGRIARLLQVPADREVRVVLPVGVPAVKRGQREKLPFPQRAWFNAYGGVAQD